ncbi:MAG TPA: anti-sigma regulatory factor [Bacteroidota bacterium]
MEGRDSIHIPITSDADIVIARQQGRALAERIGFLATDQTLIATAISEVARNIIKFAKRGVIVISPVLHNPKRGIVVVASDHGPGIPDISLAMQDGFSTGNGLGMGLPGCRRLMDEFDVKSDVGKGTTVTMKKWGPELGTEPR